jgi:hypothetical protein
MQVENGLPLVGKKVCEREFYGDVAAAPNADKADDESDRCSNPRSAKIKTEKPIHRIFLL